MRLNNPFFALLFLFGIVLQSCQKELIFQNSEATQTSSQSLENHQAKIEIWIKTIPISGRIKSSTNIVAKTVRLNGQLITKINIGDKGSSLLFISDSKTFHAYGLNTERLSFDHSGIVDIFDFQTLQKKGLRFSKGELFALVKYVSEKSMNAYLNEYPLSGLRKESSFTAQSRTASESGNIVKAVRKFFCELFGGYWQASPAEHGGINGSCYTPPNGEEQTIAHIAREDWGASNWGLIFQNINNDGFFYNNSQLWSNVIVSGSNEPGGTAISTGMIDADCSDPERIKSLLFILNTKYNQQPPGTADLSLDDTFEQFKLYKNKQQVFIPIIPWLIKAGANGAADALMQALFIYLTQDDCPSFGAAFGNDLFNKTQVGRSTVEGLIPWRTPGGKLGRAAFTAMGDVMVNLIDGRYGTDNYQLMGQDFMVGFFGDLAGGAAGELSSKYALPKIGKGLLNKFGVHYKTVARWLGGGLQQINKSYNHTLPNGQAITITADKIMKGCNPQKIAVIGRSQDDRIVPFANKLSADLRVHVHQIKEWLGWNPNLTVEQNRQWIKQLKDEGYTIYDIGIDPRYGSDKGPYYGIEYAEIFGN